MPSSLFRAFGAVTLFAWRCVHVFPGRQEKPDRKPALLNLGSGTAVARGWTNLDSDPAFLVLRSRSLVEALRRLNLVSPENRERSRQGVFEQIRFWDLRRNLPFAGESFDSIYASHLMEHLWPGDGRRLLSECFRVLRAGGVLRVVVPDLQAWAEQYAAASRGARSDGPAPRFLGAETAPHSLGREFLRIVTDWGHRTAFDFASLEHELREAGFRSIEKADFRRGRLPDLEKIEGELYHALASLYVEALK